MVVVFGLTLVLMFLFFKELLPIPITALLAAIVLTATGILSVEQGLAGFSSPATIAILAMFVLSAGIAQTGLVDRVTRKLMAWSQGSLRKQIAALSVAGPISGFVNNTPVVAIMIPMAMQMAKGIGRGPSMLLMPLSHIAMLGGLLTVIGTSTSLLGNSTMARLGLTPFGMFEFTLIGAIALIVGLAYHLTIGPLLTPDRGASDAVERYDLHGFITEFQVPDDSPLIGQRLSEAGLDLVHRIQVLRITRGMQTIEAPRRYVMLKAGDELLLVGSRETLGAIEGLVALPEVHHPLDLADDDEELATAEVVITTGSRYVGLTVAQIDFRRRYEALVLAVRHQGMVEVTPISQRKLRPGDILLIQATQRAIERMRERPDLFVTREREKNQYRTEHLPVALAIVIGVVAVSAIGLLDISIAALSGAALMVILRVLRMEEFIRAVRWDIVLLLAGIIPLGIALETTGAAALLATGLTAVGAIMPPVAFLILLFAATSLITEVVSNNASVILLIPVTTAAAISLGLDPRSVALTVMLAASTSMLSPIGYQTNTMIYAPGGYRFADYLRVGGPLNLLLAIIVPLAIVWRFGL